MRSHRLSLCLQLLSKSVFNSLYAMVKSKSCVQSLSRFQSNLRVISEAFHSILSFPCIWLAGRPASGGRLLNWFLLPLLAIAVVFLWEFTSYLLWLWNYLFQSGSFMIVDHVSIHTIFCTFWLDCFIFCTLNVICIATECVLIMKVWHWKLHLQKICLCDLHKERMQ